MPDSTNLIISIINLISLIVGGIAVGLIFNLKKKSEIPALKFFLPFLVLSVISGFCDWVIFNWAGLLIPEASANTVDLIYHILWDLIGLPAALFAFFFLVKMLNTLIDFSLTKSINLVFISLILLISALSYISLYFKLQATHNLLRIVVIKIFTYGLPIGMITYLIFSFLKAIKMNLGKHIRKFILSLLCCFLAWALFSIVPLQLGEWKRLVILIYYLALFLPAVFLFLNRNSFIQVWGDQGMDKLEKVFMKFNFTKREKELIYLILQGKSNQEISEELFISLQTVKNYVSKLYKKLGLKNRVQFVNFIRQHQ